MSTVSSRPEARGTSLVPGSSRWAVALEVLLVHAGILLYIWRWQFTYPRVWMLLLGAVLLSHLVHRDSLHSLGLAWRELDGSAGLVLPLAAAIYIPIVIYGFAAGNLVWEMVGMQTLRSFLAYGLWCLFQQYITQSYFHVRLMRLVANRHVRALLIAVMFGGAHIPNPILMAATTVGGFVFAEVFARHRNIWPLALAQAAGGFLIAALSPDSLIHNMRVGPGYYFYGLQ